MTIDVSLKDDELNQVDCPETIQMAKFSTEPDAPLKNISVSALCALTLLICGCDSLPPGTPPDGPIMEVKEVTLLNKDFSSKKMALEYMLTSVSTICPQIATGGNPPPVVEATLPSGGRFR